MSQLNILHLSDLHFGNFRYDNPSKLAIKICDTLLETNREVDVIVVSGDVFDGRRKETDFETDTESAILFFNTLVKRLIAKKLSADSFSSEDILFVPGNHDLIREKGKELDKYDNFINKYYPEGRKNHNLIFTDKYSYYCIFPEKKVVILGLKSCKVELEAPKKDNLKWIEEFDVSKFGSVGEEVKKEILCKKPLKAEWDDYGYIDEEAMDDLFTQLSNTVSNLSEHTIVATFHHHFYPFPEIVKKEGDSSSIRNYTDVVDKFQKYKVSIVLHGHKHLAINRIVTDNKYFLNPDSIIYVLAAGSAGCKDVYNPSFQWLRVFEKSAPKIAEVERYEFRNEELIPVVPFWLPPQRKEEKSIAVLLLEILQTEDFETFKKYQEITNEFAQVFQDSYIDKIIDIISGLITIFKDIKQELKKDSKLVFSLLLCINYRVIFLSQKRNSDFSIEYRNSLNKLHLALKDVFKDDNYTQNLINFLTASTNSGLDEKYYDKIIKGVKSTEKRYSSYFSISVFFTDLFLNISKYGEYYYEKENIKHKINIKLDKDVFYHSIPTQSILIEGNSDRRAIVLKFKCKNPTVHKVAVLIAKDFEMRLTRFEDSLKEINLKLYYIIPKVEPNKYDLENFHFDAYIPTLLPLLTGDNLYKSKDVFIRELVQNSIDAVLLRDKFQPQGDFDKTIKIEVGEQFREGSGRSVKYIKITDHGIGMSKFTIERYFTSIGRSYYVSEEFDELKKEKGIKYQPISNFGIGFLSSFMVCKEILVKTKSCLDNSESLEIEIPNYDGCFFIRKINRELAGTEITLYEDSRSLFQFDHFAKYAKNVFVDLPLKIEWVDNLNSENNFIIEKRALQNSLIVEKLRKKKDLIFFVPFDDKGVDKMTWQELLKKSLDSISSFGIYFNFSDFSGRLENEFITLNQGLKITKNYIPLSLNSREILPRVYSSFSSEFIQLDVAREMISFFKISIKDEDVLESLVFQIMDALLNEPKIFSGKYIYEISRLIGNVLYLGADQQTFYPHCFSLKVENVNNEKLRMSLVKNSEIPIFYNVENNAYLNNYSKEEFLNFFTFLSHLRYVVDKKNKVFEKKMHNQLFNPMEEYFIVERFSRSELMDKIIDFFRRGQKPISNSEDFLGDDKYDWVGVDKKYSNRFLSLMKNILRLEIKESSYIKDLIEMLQRLKFDESQIPSYVVERFGEIKDVSPIQAYYISQNLSMSRYGEKGGLRGDSFLLLLIFFINSKIFLLNKTQLKNIDNSFIEMTI